MSNNKCVHTEHCCVYHGCKYGEDYCPVYVGYKEQSHPCEDCDWEVNTIPTVSEHILKERQNALNNLMEDW